MCFDESEERSVTGIEPNKKIIWLMKESYFQEIRLGKIDSEESQSEKSSRMVKLKLLQDRESETKDVF